VRIIFLTDIHHAFRSLGEVLEKTDADLYLVAGDLVSRAFFRYRAAWRFMELERILGGYRSRGQHEESLLDLALRLGRNNEDLIVSNQAREYVHLSGKAGAYLRKSYERMEEVFCRHPEKTIYSLPGNYDMDLRLTALRERDLHLRFIDVGGVRIAGYGGAMVKTPGMPDHLQIPFREKHDSGKLQSEALEFFREIRPDVVALHQPPYGYLDRLPGFGHAGSHGAREYLDEAEVKLVLSGHHHEHWGAMLANGTVFFNPSNFGRVIEVSRVRPGGYFLDMILEKNEFLVATLRQFEKRGIYDILDYGIGKKGIETLILDEKRFTRLGGKVPKVSHIPPIRRLRRIKSFFLGYETPETLDLIRELRGIYRDIQRKGMEVAFDLLGSVSFGMAGGNSDMDLVVYMRSKDCVLDDEDTCGVPRPLAAVFDALKERNLDVDVCDSLDIDRVRQAILEEDTDDGQVQRFIFYRLVCRPVNLRLIKSVENELLEKEHFRREMEKGLEEYLEVLVSSVRHVSSFGKYKARLLERGITITPDVEEAIRNYLRG